MNIQMLPDSRPEAGLGHVRRCQALETALVRLGCRIVDAGASDALPDAVIIDDYRPEVLAGLPPDRPCCVVRFDDGQMSNMRADIVVNGAPGAENWPYSQPDGVTALLGVQYACLDPVIPLLSRTDIRQLVRRIVLSLGFRPPTAILQRAMEAIHSARGDEVIVCTEQADLPRMLATADIAVVGGGQTMLESLALGIPTIAVIMGENQLLQVHWLAKNQYIIDGTLPEALTTAIRDLAGNFWKREVWSRSGRMLLDGHGAERVARVIVDHVSQMRLPR